jgi:hypothetical protein
MQRFDGQRLALLAAVLALLACSGAGLIPQQRARAQSGGPYDLGWNTIDGGGITVASGGSYTLAGSIGQPDAGVLTGGGYTVRGGFWPGARLPGARIYLPLVVRDTPR